MKRARVPRDAYRAVVGLGLAALVLSGCGPGPILANPPAWRPLPVPDATPSPRPVDPLAIRFPRDDGPHDRLTEWWYYTAHLRDRDGGRYGFEYVVFRAERGAFPVSWAAHLAVTDETGDRFRYAQRSDLVPGVDRSPHEDGDPVGFAFALIGGDPSRPATLVRPPWLMSGLGGDDRLTAALAPDEAATAGVEGLAIDLTLTSARPPVLHDGDGWIDFGAAGGSYYYSRTRMTAAGTLELDGRSLSVEGIGWFDHQWGDFIAVGGGGWDWFAVNLDDGTDLTLSLVRDPDGSYPLVYGTLVGPDGAVLGLARDAFAVEATARWISPRTGAEYPAGWTITVPAQRLRIELSPTVADQELDTRATTGVVYWEGSQVVHAERDGRPLGGFAYVELTGYAPASPVP
jgi:predicted secreted hydrolase